MSLFKIELENGKFYASNRGRVQHYKTTEQAQAKIEKLGELASNAKVVECIAKTKSVKAVVKTEKSKKAKKSKNSTA